MGKRQGVAGVAGGRKGDKLGTHIGQGRVEGKGRTTRQGSERVRLVGKGQGVAGQQGVMWRCLHYPVVRGDS